MAKERHARTRPVVRIGMIGHVNDGKTTLTAAIGSILAGKSGTQARTTGEPELAHGSSDSAIGSDLTEFETAERRYTLADWPMNADYVKNMITGAAQLDAAILVVSALDGPSPQTREHLLMARQVGVPHVVVFMNKCDLVEDAEQLDLVELEVREMLSAYGFAGDEIPVIRGSAKLALEGEALELGKQSILRLAEALDSHIPTPERALDGPFLMPIEDTFVIAGRGTVVTGRIERGTVKVGDEVEIVGLRSTQKTTCIGVEMFRKLLDEGQAGDNVGVLLRGTRREDVEPGQVLCKPGSIKPLTEFTAEVHMLSKEEGGRHTPFFSNYRPQFYFRTTDVSGTMVLPADTPMAMPGDNVSITVKLVSPIAIEEGLHFAIREGGRTIGAGVVASVADRVQPSWPLKSKTPRWLGGRGGGGGGDDDNAVAGGNGGGGGGASTGGFHFRFEGAGWVSNRLVRGRAVSLIFGQGTPAEVFATLHSEVLAGLSRTEGMSVTILLTLGNGVQGSEYGVAKFAGGRLAEDVVFALKIDEAAPERIAFGVGFFVKGEKVCGTAFDVEACGADAAEAALPAKPFSREIVLDVDVAQGPPALILKLDLTSQGLLMTLLDNSDHELIPMTACVAPITDATLQPLLEQIRDELEDTFFDGTVWNSTDIGSPDWRRDAELLRCYERVASAGSLLFRKIFQTPESRRIFDHIDGRPAGTKLTITSSCALPPFEILYPRHFSKNATTKERTDNPVDPLAFWGVRFAIEIVHTGEGNEGRLRRIHKAAKPAVSFNLNPAIDGKSKEPKKIHDALIAELTGEGVACDVSGSCDAMKSILLEAGTPARVVYVYCHGAPAQPGKGSAERLDLGIGCAVRPDDMQKLRKFESAPIIVLNACLAGATSPLLFTGFLKSFRDQDALGVIATTFYVPILFGAAFGAAIVRTCLSGSLPLGEKVRQLRLKHAELGNPVPMFYSVQCQLSLQR